MLLLKRNADIQAIARLRIAKRRLMCGRWSAKEPLVEKLFLEEMERSTWLCPDFFKNIMDYLCFFVRCCLIS